ncbi:MAG: GNAT family N-acetyltransferase [Acidobacteria bacterium]|nr:GNAT family N-acetyltransferase [Acidobacteriota bacterium]
MKLRKADSDDATAISKLILSLADSVDVSASGREAFLATFETKVIERLITDNEVNYWLAFEDRQLVGAIGMKPEGHLFHLFVDRGHQSLGLGKMLVEKGCLGFDRVTVNSAPSAIGFYEKLGFMGTGDIETRNGVSFMPMLFHR